MNNTFTSYDKFLISILSLIQFTLIVDFMILSPLSAILLPELNITTSQFGMVVSAYALANSKWFNLSSVVCNLCSLDFNF